jgi:uncharacterized Zn-finger protein
MQKTMSEADRVEVESEQVSCDGGEGPLGHPRVYLNMEGKGHIVCPYCSCEFVLKEGAASHTH